MEYKNFSKCIACRTKINLGNYSGEFETTNLLNTLLFALVYPIEHRRDMHIKPRKFAEYLRSQDIVDCCGNEFNDDDILRYLRNAIAHQNIYVSNDAYGKKIESIRLHAQNLPNKPACKNPCDSPNCYPRRYNENDYGAICVFLFSPNQLRDITEMMLNYILETLDESSCESCPYRDKFFIRNRKDSK